MADQLPGEVIVRTRDEIVAEYLQDYRIRDPDAATEPGTQPYIDATTFADQQMLVYYDALVISNGTQDRTSTGTWLEKRGEAVGVARGEAVGASGFITIVASTGGGFIAEGTECRHKSTRLRFKCTVSKTYINGDEVPITGIDTGPATNLKAGEILEWTNPPVGIGPTATVFQNSDGSGLTGGRDKQDDAEYRDSIAERRANPPASGNDAEYQDAIRNIKGIGIQQPFTYPAIRQPGTIGIAFTLRPATPGASRIPNAAQLAQVEADLRAAFPGDDGIFMCSLVAQSLTVVLRVTWAGTATGWADVTPWPPYLSTTVKVSSAATPTATTFTLYTLTALSPPNPAVGNTIGLYNPSTGLFVRKRILTSTMSTSGAQTRWAIVVDTTNNASDTGYTPVAEQVVSPWSDSLDLVAPAVIEHIDGTGPGEQVSTFYDPGTRQKRQPTSPASWPHQITNRILAPIFDLPSILDVILAEPTVPYSTTVGTPGVESYLFQLGDLAIMKQ